MSTTIDKYVYVNLKDNLGGYFRLRYQDVREKVYDVDHIKHDLIRETIKLTGLQDTPLDIVIMSDLAGESGLGTSGSVTVGLLNAMYAFKDKFVSQQRLLEEACHIEVDILEGASGYHDPSICALGGLKLIEYHGNKVQARAVQASPETRQKFQDSMLFFYGGRHHKSKPSLDLLTSQMEKATPILHDIKRIGFELEKAFESGNLRQIAEIIGQMQDYKQQLPGKFVDDYVLDITERVRKHGAYAQLPGGKISAFVMVCCPDGQHDAIRQELSELKETSLKLEHEGTKAIRI